MSYGPVRMDFTPLGQIGSSFTNARDQAIDRQFKMAQLTAPSEIASIMAQNSGQGSATPPANAQPGMVPLGSVGQGKAPSFAAMQGVQPNADYASMFSDEERKYALPAGYLSRTAAIESRFDPNAQNPNSSAGGMFQFTDGTAKQYGLSNKYDPAASTDAAARLAADNRAVLMKTLGREPTAGELYLAHQQGAGGALKLLANPNARAVDVVGSQAVALNGGDPNMTAGQFATLWTRKIDGQGGGTSQASPADVPAPGAQPAQYVIPGSGQAVPAQAQAPYQVTAPQIPVPPYIKALAASSNPYVRAEATKLYLQYQQQQQQYALEAWKLNQNQGFELRKQQADQDFNRPYKEGTMAAQQGRADAAKSQAETAARREDFQESQPLVINGVALDRKTMQPVYTAPNVKTEVVDGRIVHIDQNAATAKDITPEGLPNGYRPMTPEERQAFQVPENTGAYIGPGNKPAVLQGTSNNVINNIGEAAKAREALADQYGLQGTDRQNFILTGKVPTIAEKTPTESQSNAATYAMRMKAADQILSDPAVQKASTSTDRILGQVPVAGNFLVSSDYQRADQAQRDFINAVLRRESGAAISPAEFDNARKQYFPQPGDSEPVLAQKAANRRTAIAGIETAAGPALPKAEQHNQENNAAAAQTQAQPQAKSRPKLGAVPIPMQAVKDLKAMPDTPENRAYFDDVFGDGASDRILGRKPRA